MIGAKVQIVRPSGPTLWRRAHADGSYASANDPRLVIGLGDSTEPPAFRVWWPDGTSEEFPEAAIDRWIVLEQGKGRVR